MDVSSDNQPIRTSSSASPDSGSKSKAISSVSDTLSASPRVNSPTSNAPKAILSCDFCRQRKTKCDKAEGGCSNCKRAGIKCNMPTRQRLPRGRNGGRTKVDAELKARVGRLESLVRSLGGKERLGDTEVLERALSNTSVTEKPALPEKDYLREPLRKTSTAGSELGRYLGSSFWTNLSDEITGLRDVLDQGSDEELETEESSRSTPSGDNSIPTSSNNFSFVLCTPEGMFVNPDVLQHPPRFMIIGLCSVYLRAVDPMFKLVHAPSLSKFMRNSEPYLDYPRNHPAPQALAFAVYFAALNSQSDQECRENFGESKTILVSRYRIALEAALSRADLLITNDITVLSAFLLLIIFSRVSSNDRRPWTLLSLALRISQAVGLHREDSQPAMSPFWREIRRRVWNAIGVIDAQASGDRGTEPLIFSYETHVHTTPPPLNINDSDFAFDSNEIQEREGITDVSFALVCNFADRAAVRLGFSAAPEWCSNDKLAWDWEMRKEFAIDWRKSMHDKFLKHCDSQRPIHQVIHQVVEIISIDLLLSGIRPLYRHPKSKPPRVSGDYILSLCATALERSAVLQSMPAFKDFHWFGRQYNQWHAIAVMVAELCIHTQGPTVERSWAILDRSLDFYKQIIADSEKGMLWRPIEKLLRKARETRRRAVGEQPSTYQPDCSTAEGASFPPLDMASPIAQAKSKPPQTANAAMVFNQYFDASVNRSTVGGASGVPNPAEQWQLPPEFMNMDIGLDKLGGGSNTASPENAWQNWGCFTDGLQDDPLFPAMQVDSGANNTGMGISSSTTPFPWY